MQISRLTIVAMVIAAASSFPALAEPSEAFRKCAELGPDHYVVAQPYCEQAAEENDEGKVLLGDFYAHHELMTLAVSEYSRVADGVDWSNPTQIEYDALRGRALATFSMEWKDPVDDPDEDAHKALKLVPNDVELLRAGAEHSLSKERKLEYADRLVALDPKSVYHHATRAYTLADVDDLDGALAAAETAMKVAPGSPVALTARGYIHGLRKDYVKAEKDFVAVTRKTPDELGPWVDHAEVLIMLKRYTEARASATKALSIDAKHSRALLARASASLNLGDGEASLSDLAGVKSREDADFAGRLRYSAEVIIKTKKMITPESVARLEQDRTVIVKAAASQLLNNCGDYSVASNPDQETLATFRDCLKRWYQSRNNAEFKNQPSIVGAVTRFLETGAWIDDASMLVCSRMEKGAHCIDDKLYLRAVAAADDFNDPQAAVGNAEFARLNREIDAYNARTERPNKLDKTASFVQSVADAPTE